MKMEIKEIVDSLTKMEQNLKVASKTIEGLEKQLLDRDGKIMSLEIEAKEDKKLLKIFTDQKEEIDQRLKSSLSAILKSAKTGLTPPEVKEEPKK